jgi:hypothetical protein
MQEKYIVGLSINKVQTFLFETIHAHVQEKQTEEATLKNIMKASREISKGFQNDIEELFFKGLSSQTIEGKWLLRCSGSFIFECELLENELKEQLNKLFLSYYHKSQGQKLLRHTVFKAGAESKIEQISKAKRTLKESKCFNGTIKIKQNELFAFQCEQCEKQDAVYDNEKKEYNKLCSKSQ